VSSDDARTVDPGVVGPSDGLTLRRPKVVERIALSSTVTSGSLACLEVVVRPGGLVAPVHVHTYEDETVFVVEGTVSVRLGDRTLRVDAGSMVFGPRGVPHAFWNEGDTTVRMMMTVIPGESFETYFRSLPNNFGDDLAATAQKLVMHAANFGLELRPDSLDELAKRYHVALF
jgi:quercetin dioxygenase-like cupin family protein